MMPGPDPVLPSFAADLSSPIPPPSRADFFLNGNATLVPPTDSAVRGGGLDGARRGAVSAGMSSSTSPSSGVDGSARLKGLSSVSSAAGRLVGVEAMASGHST
jgi:hypothetical protein